MQKKKEEDVRSIWMYNQREDTSEETLFNSDKDFRFTESNGDLINLNMSNSSFQNNSDWPKNGLRQISKRLLQTVKLDSISIPSTVATQHIVHLKQSFNFASPFKSSTESSTQTSDLDRHLTTTESPSQRLMRRPTSLPPENIALSNLGKRVQADVGDGFGVDIAKYLNESNNDDSRQPDLEIAGIIPQMPVQCVLITPKSEKT